MHPLGGICEEGGELMNKIMRHLKEHGARKTSTEDSCEDILNHMFQASSPRLASMDRIKPKRAKRTGLFISPTKELDELIKTLFLDDGPQGESGGGYDEAEDEALFQWAFTGVHPEWVQCDLNDDP